MMGKTHIAVGIATSVAILQPHRPLDCLLAVMGGAIGGAICDIDTLNNDKRHDALFGQLLVIVLIAAGIYLDYRFDLGFYRYLQNHNQGQLMVGLVLFIVLWVLGFVSPHRSFTHSLLGFLLFTAAVETIYPPLSLPFAAGFLSHLALDVLNKKDLKLLYPLKHGFCLRLCYSDRLANRILLSAGTAMSVFLIALSIISFLP